MTTLQFGKLLAGLALALTITGCAVTNAAGQAATVAPSTVTIPVTVTQTQTVVVVSTVVVASAVTSSATASATTAVVAPSTTTAVQLPSTSAVASSASLPTTPHATPTSAPGGLAVTQASTVALEFLGAYEHDPSGKTSMPYLSSRLQAQIQNGRPVSTLLGVSGVYSQYHADAAISRGGGRAATVRVTLTYASGLVQRLVTLIPEGGAWRIDDIADTSA